MRHGRSLTLSVLLGGILLATPLLAQAGGTIKGKVTYSGPAVPAKEFVFSKFPNPAFCKKNASKKGDDIRLLKEVEVGGDKGLKSAIVSVRDITDKGLAKSYKPEVMAELCEFLPFTGVLANKGKFYVENKDADASDPKSAEGVLHNPHSFDVLGAKSATLFNIGLAKKGDNLEKTIKMRMAKKGSVLRLQCDQHEFMQAWYLPVKNMHFATSGADGSFEIKDVPAGKHKVLAWHPIAGNVEMDVEVKDGATVEVNFDIKKKGNFKG